MKQSPELKDTVRALRHALDSWGKRLPSEGEVRQVKWLLSDVELEANIQRNESKT